MNTRYHNNHRGCDRNSNKDRSRMKLMVECDRTGNPVKNKIHDETVISYSLYM